MASRKGTYRRRADSYIRHKSINNNHYNNTSSAYDYAEETYAPKPVKRKRIRGSSKDVYVRAENPLAKPGLAVYGAIAVVFMCAIVSIVTASNTATQRISNGAKLEELKLMQSKTAELKIEVSQSMDLEEIERIARTKLEMSEPQMHQIVYIDIPKQNYTVSISEDDSAANETDTELSAISGVIEGLFKE